VTNTKEDTSKLLGGGELGQAKEEDVVRTLCLQISFNEHEHMLIVDERGSEMLRRNIFKENRGCIEEDSTSSSKETEEWETKG